MGGGCRHLHWLTEHLCRGPGGGVDKRLGEREREVRGVKLCVGECRGGEGTE